MNKIGDNLILVADGQMLFIFDTLNYTYFGHLTIPAPFVIIKSLELINDDI